MTHSQRVALGSLLDGYDRSASPVVTITAPVGSANSWRPPIPPPVSGAPAFARGSAIADHVTSYQAPSVDISAPVRVAFTAMRAQTNKCGRWPEDILDNPENKHYADFGCSYQNNLAAQIADPADLLGPRKLSEVDAEERSVVIDEYRKAPVPPASEVDF